MVQTVMMNFILDCSPVLEDSQAAAQVIDIAVGNGQNYPQEKLGIYVAEMRDILLVDIP